MIRREAVRIFAKKIGTEPIISANGFISRDLFEACEKDSNFYMIGSMGLASSIGLGVALKNSKRRVYIFDGDGNLFMNLGSLATMGTYKPKNLVHIVFDNNLHESTGGQPTHSNKIDLGKIAKAANYTVFKLTTKKNIDNMWNKIKKIQGPVMILIKVEKSNYVSKRVSIHPYKIRDRFQKLLKK